MASDTCQACGRAITTVHNRRRPGIHLEYVWVHYSWWANKTHAAIPRNLKGGDHA